MGNQLSVSLLLLILVIPLYFSPHKHTHTHTGSLAVQYFLYKNELCDATGAILDVLPAAWDQSTMASEIENFIAENCGWEKLPGNVKQVRDVML